MIKDFDGIRSVLLKKYSLDIANAKCNFSTRNYAFVFSMDYCSVVIRVSPANLRMREEVLSEFMWVDDLKQFHTTVCQLFVSAKNKAVEERATFDFNSFRYALTDGIIDIMNETKDRVMSIPKTPQTFSMIHGDYWPGNYFVSGDEIWVFDFDDCGYGYFMFDIVTSLSQWIQEPRFMPLIKRRDLLYNKGMLDSFKRGYLENYSLPSEAWEDLELFLKLRYMEQLTIIIPAFDNRLREIIGFDMVELDKKIVLAKDDFYEVLDELAQSFRNK